MASTLQYFVLTIFFTSLIHLKSVSSSDQNDQSPTSPSGLVLVLPVRKDNATNLHTTNLRKRTPQVSVPLVVDLNGRFLWVVCEHNYLSSTYNAPFCHSTQCSHAGVHYCHKCYSTAARPGCHNNTCAVITTNPLTHRNAISELAEDVVSIQSMSPKNGATGVRWASVRRFLFACAPSSLWQGSPLPQGVQGIAGLGHTPVALPTQLASRFGFHPQFFMCLGTSTHRDGAIFFGNVPSNVTGNRKLSLSYTPLTIGAQGEYFVLVKSIIINYKMVPFNTSLLSTSRGFKGTMISTTAPYTVLHHSVYTAFAQFYAHEMMGVPQVQAVPPFGLCFDTRIIPPTRVGVPNIDFAMQNRNVTWRMHSYDNLIRMSDNATCLAYVDGGPRARATITLGAYHLENNFLHFDLLRSRLGFVPSRMAQGQYVDCSQMANFATTH